MYVSFPSTARIQPLPQGALQVTKGNETEMAPSPHEEVYQPFLCQEPKPAKWKGS